MDYDRRPSLFWPLLFIGLGALLLAQNFGLLPAGLWPALAQLWPVIFILIGLDMLLGRRSSGTAGVLVLGSLIVAGALSWAAIQANQLPPGTAQEVFQYGHDADQLAVSLDFKAGELQVSALDDSRYVMEGQVQNGSGERFVQRYDVRAGTGRLRLEQDTQPLLLPFLASRGATARWSIGLSGSLPLELEVITGAGRSTLDLRALQVTALDLRTGVGQTQVMFPAAGGLAGSVRTGVGETTLVLPANVPARLTVRSGVTSLDVPARFGRAGDVYTTPGFEPESEYIDLTVWAGIGKVIVK